MSANTEQNSRLTPRIIRDEGRQDKKYLTIKSHSMCWDVIGNV